MFKAFGLVALAGLVLQVAAICGVIYFVFWCLREFGILAALGV